MSPPRRKQRPPPPAAAATAESFKSIKVRASIWRRVRDLATGRTTQTDVVVAGLEALAELPEAQQVERLRRARDRDLQLA